MSGEIRVLLVGGEAGAIDPSRLETASESMTVVTERTASEAVSRLETDAIHCLLVPADLPESTPIDLLERVAVSQPTLPVVFDAGPDGAVTVDAALEAGATDFVPQDPPVDRYSLLETRIRGVVTTAHDEEDDRPSEAYYRTLMEHTADYVMVVDTSGRVEYVSPSVERILGYRPAELKQTDAFETIHPDDYDIAASAFEALFAQPDQEQTAEYRAQAADGEWRWLEVRGRNCLDDPLVEGIIVTVRDITDQQERKWELQRTERRFEAMFNDPNILVGLIDTDGTVLDINETAMEYVEAGVETLVGEPFPETPWFEGDDAAQGDVREMIDRATAGEYVEFEFDHSTAVGQPLVVSGVFRPVTDDRGEVVSLLISARNITARKHHQRELELRNRAIEAAPLGITIADAEQPDNPLVYVNETFEEGTGYDADDVVGENCRMLQGEGTDPESVAELRAAIDAAEPTTVELRNYRADGEEFWNRVSIAPIYDDAGEVTDFVGFQEDITDLKERQQESLRNERRFKALFDGPHLLIGLLDTDGTLLDANETAMEYIDEALTEIRGEKLWRTPWWSDEMRPVIEDAVEKAAGGEYVPYEADLTDHEGDPYSVVGVIRPVTDTDGNVTSLVVSVRDITERRQRERELAESEARYQSLTEDVLDTSDVGTFVLGPEFDIVWVNQAVVEYFYIDRSAVLGRDKPTVIREEIADIFEDGEAFARQVLGGYEDNTGVTEFECHVLPGPGRSERWLTHWSRPIESGLYEGGRIEHYTDVTDRVKRDQQLDVMDRVLRHNLHNDMAIILGAAETIAEQTSDDVTEFVEMIQESGHRLLDVTDKQRDIVEVVSEDPDVTTVDVGQHIQHAVRRVLDAHPTATVALTDVETVAARAIPQIMRAAEELIENAVVHAPTDDETVAVSVRRTAEHARIEISDSNDPIPESERAILRGEAERGPLYHGSGMGLWLVNWIVTASNGRLTYDANSPSGNRVTIVLPLSEGDGAPLFGRSLG